MLGLMLKDFYETFCLKKNLIGLILSFLLFNMIFFVLPNKYNIILIVTLCVPFMAISPLQYSIERDEISKFDQILLTYPLTRKQIIQTKILETHIYNCFSFIFFSLHLLILAIFFYQVLTIKEALLVLSGGIILSLIMLPINNIGFMAFGNKKGNILFMAILCLIVIGYVILHFRIGVEKILTLPLFNWYILGILLAIILNIAGYYACLKIYNRKHS